MEIANPVFCASMKRCKRRGHYQRLNDERNRRPGHWRLPKTRVMVPKLQSKKKSSLKLLRRYRDAYVKTMLKFAGRFVQLNNGNVFFFKRISSAANFLQFGSKAPVSSSFKLN